MNAHESDRLREMLLRGGLEVASVPEKADFIIFQTCSIRDTAARKVITHILQAKKHTKAKICVIGCLDKKIPAADIQLGTNELEKLAEMICGTRPDARFGVGNSVIIMHGCQNFCAYCIVPYVRGKETSRDIDEIIAEFTQIKDCKKVIYLLGQNVNSYKCPRTGADFVTLLDKVCAVEGDFVINFLSSHPKDFTPALVDCIARNPKIERNIHLPLQSGSNKVLKLMNRGYTVEQYLEKIDLLRKRVDGVRITTDIICGFPGESEEDFLETVNVMRRVKFNAWFVFAYSIREGTAAQKMDGHLDEKIKKERTTRLLAELKKE
jgi:tRNA-2-methylthio-N6-dimethylallyladenosine synthase